MGFFSFELGLIMPNDWIVGKASVRRQTLWICLFG